MRILTIIALAGLSLLLSACGSEGGVPAQIHEKIQRTPPTTEQAALSMLDSAVKKLDSQKSITNQAIRKDTLGLHIVTKQLNKSEISIDVELAFAVGVEQCSIAKYLAVVKNNQLSNWFTIENLGRVRCVNSNCTYLLLLIEQSHSQFINNDGTPVLAAVPVILKDRNDDKAAATGDYIPTDSSDSIFLELKGDVNTTCIKPVEIKGFQQPVSPVDTDNEPDYSYFPLDDNNTWFTSN